MPRDEAREQMAALVAAFDQFKQSAKEIAGTVAAYRTVLIASGVSEADALQLTLNYQALMLGSILGMFGQVGE